jgi:hypothetical protein
MRGLLVRTGFLIAIVLACSTPAWPKGDVNAAKAANTRGMELYKKKDYKGAAAQFRAAIAADPTHVQAHYNLACVSSLLHDGDGAMAELKWVSNRSSWDEQAKAKTLKAKSDPDLKWIIDNDENANTLVGEDGISPEIDLLNPKSGVVPGNLLPDADKAKATQLLAATPGKHDGNCDAADAKQGRIYGADVETTAKAPKLLALVSLRDGLALFDRAGTLLARSEPIGCTTTGASQDMVTALTLFDTPAGSFFAVAYGNGGRSQWTNNVAIFARRNNKMVRVFEGTTASSDAATSGKLLVTPLGDLAFEAAGERTPHGLHWKAAAFKFDAIE